MMESNLIVLTDTIMARNPHLDQPHARIIALFMRAAHIANRTSLTKALMKYALKANNTRTLIEEADYLDNLGLILI